MKTISITKDMREFLLIIVLTINNIGDIHQLHPL